MINVLSFDVGLVNLSYSRISLSLPVVVSKRTERTPWSWKNLDVQEMGLINVMRDNGVFFKLKDFNSTKVTKCLNASLAKRLHLVENIHCILVESQPFAFSKKEERGGNRHNAIKLQIVAHNIIAFYTGYFTGKKSPIISFVSAKYKLRVNPEQTTFFGKPTAVVKGTTYSYRKTKSVGLAMRVLNQCTVQKSLTNTFFQSDKKDDLSDSLLAAVFILQQCDCVLKRKINKR